MSNSLQQGYGALIAEKTWEEKEGGKHTIFKLLK